MRIHVFVEGASEEALLRVWLRRFLPGHQFQIIKHRGKGKLPGDPSKRPDPKRQGLLDQLPAYSKILNPNTDRILVLVDLDDDDHLQLKKKLEGLLLHCQPKPDVLFRIAIEETEAFYLGDRKAIQAAFPGAKLKKLNSYEQDSICGTWERFADVIGAKSGNKVVTGAQVPLAQTRNDGLRNLVTAMVIAATEPSISESTLFFGINLLRGNRSEKVNASEFPAFGSPNFTPLGTAGIGIVIDEQALLPPPPAGSSLAMADNRARLAVDLAVWKERYKSFSIISLLLYPGIQASTVEAMLASTQPEVKGVIILAFGAGNAPANDELIAALKGHTSAVWCWWTSPRYSRARWISTPTRARRV